MAEELTNARAVLQRQTRDAQGVIQDLLSEREEFSRVMMLTHRYLIPRSRIHTAKDTHRSFESHPACHLYRCSCEPVSSFPCVSIVRSLEQLLVSLQWGRQQTYYPSAQPLSTGELAVANYKLADAINSHLLGNVGSSVVKSSSSAASELCNTPAEKMAEKVRA